MTMIQNIRGKEYLPLRSLPFVSSNVLDPSTVIDMILHPEKYCDAEYDSILTPIYFDQWSLANVTMPSFRASSASGVLPPGVLVREKPARNMFNLCSNEGINLPAIDGKKVQTWNVDTHLPYQLREFVYEDLPQPRKNFRSSMIADIKAGVQQISRICEDRGMTIDHTHLPGTSLIWHHYMIAYRCMGRHISCVTFKDHMKELGFRWGQGRRVVRDAWFTSYLDDHLTNKMPG